MWKRIPICLLYIVFAFFVNAEITLPSLIADNMVLQQQTDVKLWGRATPNRKVKVHTTWSSESYNVKSDTNGDWLLAIKTPVAGGPYTISFNDGIEKKVTNVMIGEVWLCSGQSNMEMTMKGYPGQPVSEAQNTLASADPSIPIRFMTVEKNNSLFPLDNIQSKWRENSSLYLKDLSALAYYYGLFLQSVLKVPVGIIVSSWGGSNIETWMDSTTLSQFKKVKLTNTGNPDVVFQRDCQLYNGMIYPLHNFAIKGVLWYQGESNVGQEKLYKQQFPAMVAQWRKLWNIGDFPFYYAQIAPWKYKGVQATTSARFREMQQNLRLEVPNTEIVATVDTGDSLVIHPPMKKLIGERFAYVVLNKTYNCQGIEYRTPEFKSMTISNDTIMLDFKNAEDGLNSKTRPITGFEIAGINRIFKPARAALVKKGVIKLTESTISNPVAARYAFKNYSPVSLFSNLGFPLVPFRTDNWEDK